MRMLIIATTGILVCGCDSASSPKPIPQTKAAVKESTPAPVAPDPIPVQVAPPPHDTWLADIRPEEAMLYFGPPESDYIGFKMRCVSGSGRASIAMPSFGDPILALTSGSDSETFPSKIVPDAEGGDDQVETLNDVALDHRLWRNFLRTGQLAAAKPLRELSATTGDEKSEIERFFSACEAPASR